MVKQHFRSDILDLSAFNKKSQTLLRKYACLQERTQIPLLSLTSGNEWICQQKAESLDDTIYKATLHATIANLEAAIKTENAVIKELNKLSTGFCKQIEKDISPLEQIGTTEKKVEAIQQKLVKNQPGGLQTDLEGVLRKLEAIEGDAKIKR